MERWFGILGALSALLAVAAGAFGAHGLKDRLSVDQLGVYEVGVRYQMYHALGLLAVAWAVSHWQGEASMRAAGWLMLIGTLLFSGSLYALAFGGPKWLGMITPIGGLAFVIGWGLLAWGIWRGGR